MIDRYKNTSWQSFPRHSTISPTVRPTYYTRRGQAASETSAGSYYAYALLTYTPVSHRFRVYTSPPSASNRKNSAAVCRVIVVDGNTHRIQYAPVSLVVHRAPFYRRPVSAGFREKYRPPAHATRRPLLY